MGCSSVSAIDAPVKGIFYLIKNSANFVLDQQQLCRSVSDICNNQTQG